MKRFFPLTLALIVSACGTLPEPFYGNSGPEAARLSIPPAPMLLLPAPTQAQLSRPAATQFTQDLAAQLVNYDIPSLAGAALPGNWQLGITATQSGSTITPAYAIIGPDGKIYGRQSGQSADAQAWRTGDPATLNTTATADAATLARLLASINAKIQQSNPQSLENRAPRVFIAPVTGAPGDGDASLALNLGRDLPGTDLQIVTDPKQADFIVTGHITAKPQTDGQLQVELDWVVRDENNRVAGQVTQLHDLDPGDIEPYWGDVAAAAATEAADGITHVVQNAVIKKP